MVGLIVEIDRNNLNYQEVLKLVADKSMQKQADVLKEKSSMLTEVARGISKIKLIKILKLIDPEDASGATVKELADIAKRLAEVDNTMKDKGPEVAVQINNTPFSKEEAERFDIEL